jgi:hypothetical protein
VAAKADADEGLRLDLELVAACCRLALAQRAHPDGAEPVRRAQVEVGAAHLRRHKLEREALAPSPVRSIAEAHRLSAHERVIFLFAVAPTLSGEVASLYRELGGAGPRLFAELVGGIGGALSPEATLVRTGLVTPDGVPGPNGLRIRDAAA